MSGASSPRGGTSWGHASPAERVLVLLAAGLFALAVVLLLLPAAGDPAPGRFTLAPGAPVATGAAARDAEGEAAIALARPLFSATRRPPAVTAAEPTELPRLAGVIVGEGAPKAIFAAEGDGKPPVLGVGQSIAGHTIRAITAGAVVLDNHTVLHPAFAPADGQDALGAASPAIPALPGFANTARMPAMTLPFGGPRPGMRRPGG